MCGQTCSVPHGPSQGSIPTGTAMTGHTSVSEAGYLGPKAVSPTLSLNYPLVWVSQRECWASYRILWDTCQLSGFFKSKLFLEMSSSGKSGIPKNMLGSPDATPVSYTELSGWTGSAGALLNSLG